MGCATYKLRDLLGLDCATRFRFSYNLYTPSLLYISTFLHILYVTSFQIWWVPLPHFGSYAARYLLLASFLPF